MIHDKFSIQKIRWNKKGDFSNQLARHLASDVFTISHPEFSMHLLFKYALLNSLNPGNKITSKIVT